MARQFLLPLLALIIVSLSIPSTLASDTPSTTFIRKTCNDATYIDLCLNTLLPNADRIRGNPKKATRLAIMAAISQVQSTSSNITHLSKQPQLWIRELNSLQNCGTTITDTVVGLLNAMEATNHLGGGTKGDKESKRLNIENDIKTVVSATNSCMNNLQGSRARDVVIDRVKEAMEPLAELATNAVDLIHHLEF